MKGKKMGWVGSTLTVQLTPIDICNLEILCEGARYVFLLEERYSPPAV